MNTVVRLSVLFTTALFWGGLTFYTGFVVRVSHDVLDDAMDGGLITQRVTSILQILAAVSVATMLLNAAFVIKHARRFGIALVLLSLILLLSVAGLFWVHAQLDAIIDVADKSITDHDAFTILHRRYNQFTTSEWIATVLYLALLPLAWRKVDIVVAKQGEEESGATA